MIRLKDFVPNLRSDGIPAAAITDSHNMFGVLEYSSAAMKEGIQPIIGCEVILDGSEFLLEESDFGGTRRGEENFCKMVLLAKTDQGVLNLMSLVSQSYLSREDDVAPHIGLEELAAKKDGLIALSGGSEGVLGKMILQNKHHRVARTVGYFLNLFGEDFYMEILRHGLESEINSEHDFINIAYDYGIPLVATNDCYFYSKDLFEAQDALSCIAGVRYVSETNRPRLTREHYFKSETEMRELFIDIPEAIENTVKITNKISATVHGHRPMLPHFDLPEGVSEAEEILRAAKAGLEKRLERKFIVDCVPEKDWEFIRKQYFDRLQFELDVITNMDFAGYFLIVADFIVWSKTHGVPVGPGRGSGVGSLVGWSLRITELDPIKFGLFFERFLNPERISMPDFDVDFCQRGRSKTIEYVQNKYGKDKVAQIITFGKLQSRAVIKDVGRVLGMGYGDVDRISKMIPFSASLGEALSLDQDLRVKRQSDPDMSKLFDIAISLEGLNRHSSIHAAGIVIGAKSLEKICPLYFDKYAEMPVVQYDKKYCEEAGLVKFDFLGLKTLTVINDTVNFVEQIEGIKIDIDNIDLCDRDTYDLLKRADALGVFQIESTGMMGVLKQIRPDNIEDIMALLSLYRPGPMDNIPMYIRRKHGLEKTDYRHPKMEPVLRGTYGIIIYQEQVMDIAKTLAGYTLGAADTLRKAMGKKIREEMERQRSVFIEGCATNSGIDSVCSGEIFDILAKFAEYGFNKSHAAAYAIISYQTAYLKAHYPVEFLTSTLNMEIIDTDKINYYLQDIKKHRITILPPDVNASDTFFRVELTEPEVGKNKSKVYYHGGKELAIRYGLRAIKGVGQEITEDLIAERSKNGAFRDIFDFCGRMGARVVNKKTMESLAKSGSFDGVENNRRRIHDSWETLASYAKVTEDERNSPQIGLFDRLENREGLLPRLQNVGDWIGYERFQMEFEAFGFYLKNHPLDMIKTELGLKGITFFDEIEEITGDNFLIKMAGVVITTSIRSSDRGRYAFLTISDPTGLAELSLFSGDLLGQHSNLLDDRVHNHLVFECIVHRDDSGSRISIRDLWPLDQYLKNTKAGVLKVKKLKNTGDFFLKNRASHSDKNTVKGAKDSEDFSRRKNNFIRKINIHIFDESCVESLFSVIEGTKNILETEHTDINIVVNGEIVKLPNEFHITETEISEIRKIPGVEGLEMLR
jgi:DNA polymerase-3 subunit alpha